MRNLQIVSVPVPSGASWLGNVLLELNLRLTTDRASWIETPQGSRLASDAQRDKLIWHLPALQRRSHFHFDAEIEFFWEHRLDFCQYPGRKTLLYLRDPRDAAYSYYRRLAFELPEAFADTEAGFLAWLRQPESWVQYFPGLFDLPIAETQAYFNLFWLCYYRPEQLLTVRHEDTKRDPLGQLERILAFCGIERSRAEMEQAIAQSDIKTALAQNRQLMAETGKNHLTHRSGAVEEWRQSYTPEALSCFAGPAEALLQAGGYPPLPNSAPPLPPQALLAQAEPLLAGFDARLRPGELQAAERYLLAALPAQPQAIYPLSGALLLALRWTRALLGEAQSHLPQAVKMVRIFSDFNLGWLSSPSVRDNCLRILNQRHVLHQAQPAPSTLISALGESLPAALARAKAAGQSLVFWRQRELLIEQTALFQLQALLDGRHPGTVAVIPCQAAQPLTNLAAVTGFRERAYVLHAQAGAESESYRLEKLPLCLLLRSDAEPPQDDLEAWLAGLAIRQATGLLCQAWEPSSETAGEQLPMLLWLSPEPKNQTP